MIIVRSFGMARFVSTLEDTSCGTLVPRAARAFSAACPRKREIRYSVLPGARPHAPLCRLARPLTGRHRDYVGRERPVHLPLVPPRRRVNPVAISGEQFEKRLGVPQVGGVEPFGEPTQLLTH